MTPRHWLIKFAPFRTSWPEIVARNSFTPRGIRSPEARKHLKSMKVGDPVVFFQSQQNQAAVGLMEVTRTASHTSLSYCPNRLEMKKYLPSGVTIGHHS